MKVNRAEMAFVVALLLFAAGLRLIGVEHGMPPDMSAFPTEAARDMIPDQVAVQPDEFLFVARPFRMVVTRQLNPQYFENPSFLINLNFFTFLLTGEGKGITFESWQGIGEREQAPFRFYVIGRTYSALIGLLALAAVYALVRRVAGRRAALLAGLLVATSETLVQHAHYTTSTSVAGGFAAVAMWAAIASLYRPRLWLFALAGIAAGLAAGSRYNAAAVSIVVFCAGLVLLYRDRGWRGLRLVLIGWALVPATFVLTTPHILFETEQVLKDFRYITAQYVAGAGIALTTPYGLFFEYRYLVLFGVGVPAALAVIVGLWAAWQARKPFKQNSAWLAVLILAAYVVPYSLVVLRTARPGHSDQLLVPVIPAFAVVAGIGAGWLAARFARWRWKSMTPLIALALVIVPLALSVQLVRQYTRTDTRYVMQAWIYDHLPRGSRIQLNGPYNVPLDPSLYSWTQNYGGDLKSVADLRAEGVEYVVLSDAWYHDEARSHEISSPDYLRQIDEYLATFAALPVVARLERPALLGDDWMMYTATVWANPGLTVYCLNEASCAAVR